MSQANNSSVRSTRRSAMQVPTMCTETPKTFKFTLDNEEVHELPFIPVLDHESLRK